MRLIGQLTLCCIIIIPSMSSMAYAPFSKALHAHCVRDQDCKSAYCLERRCTVWGDQIIRPAHWGDEICRQHTVKPNNSTCCYDWQCCSHWCAMGLCSSKANSTNATPSEH